MPFAPGVSGNPGGRVKAGESLREVLRSRLTPEKKAKIADILYKRALSGDIRALALLYDNHDGRLPQLIGGATDDDGNEQPIPIRLLPPA